MTIIQDVLRLMTATKSS